MKNDFELESDQGDALELDLPEGELPRLSQRPVATVPSVRPALSAARF